MAKSKELRAGKATKGSRAGAPYRATHAGDDKRQQKPIIVLEGFMSVLPIVTRCEVCNGPFSNVKFLSKSVPPLTMCFACSNTYIEKHGGQRIDLEQYHLRGGRWVKIDFEGPEPEDL